MRKPTSFFFALAIANALAFSPSLVLGEANKGKTAQGETGKSVPTASQSSTSNTPAVVVKDVETLIDDLNVYIGKKVTVAGKVEDKVDARSFVLESGGFLNNEIAVITGPNVKSDLVPRLKEDATVTVTGTIRTIPIVEVRRELSWDLDPQIETEFQGATAFFVADEIKEVRK